MRIDNLNENSGFKRLYEILVLFFLPNLQNFSKEENINRLYVISVSINIRATEPLKEKWRLGDRLRVEAANLFRFLYRFTSAFGDQTLELLPIQNQILKRHNFRDI
jgi:hypothetical protein